MQHRILHTVSALALSIGIGIPNTGDAQNIRANAIECEEGASPVTVAGTRRVVCLFPDGTRASGGTDLDPLAQASDDAQEMEVITNSVQEAAERAEGSGLEALANEAGNGATDEMLVQQLSEDGSDENPLRGALKDNREARQQRREERQAAREAERAEAEAQAQAQAEAEAQAELEAQAEAEAQADTQARAQEQAQAEAEVQTQAQAETTTEQPNLSSENTAAALSEDGAVVSGAGERIIQIDTERSAQRANRFRNAIAAQIEGNTTTGEARSEIVTEETARSSSEEPGAARTAQTPVDDSGLSNFEKFALGALGIAAVSAILDNDEEVVASTSDRAVVQGSDGQYRVLKNDDELLRQPGVRVDTKEFADGSTRSIVTRENGEQVITIRAADGQVLKRTRVTADGQRIVLFDDTQRFEPVNLQQVQNSAPSAATVRANDDADLRAALAALENPTDRAYSLQQIREIRAVRELMPLIELDDINFETGSATIRPEEARDLTDIGRALASAIAENPNEIFLIEGHTDAVGGAAMNLVLSDRRAESAALALTEYFDIPPENLVVQGYGEANLKVPTADAERANRRVAVRRITPLLVTELR